MTLPDTLDLVWFHRGKIYKNVIVFLGLVILYWL